MLSMFKMNILKQYFEFKRYFFNTLLEVISLYIVLMGLLLGFSMVGGEVDHFEEKMEYVVAGYIIWIISYTAVQAIGYEVYNDLQRGTLDQLYMTPLPVWQIMLGRMVGNVMFRIVGVVLLLLLSMVTTGIYLYFDLLTLLPIFLVTLISMFGVGYMVAGLCLLLKQVSNLLMFSQLLMMSVIYIPLESAPYLKYLPFIYGVDLLKKTMLYEAHLIDFSLWQYGFLALNSLFYFILGIYCYSHCEKTALDRGILGKY